MLSKRLVDMCNMHFNVSAESHRVGLLFSVFAMYFQDAVVCSRRLVLVTGGRHSFLHITPCLYMGQRVHSMYHDVETNNKVLETLVGLS